MAKEEKKKPRVHYCRRVKHDPETWFTTCGLKLTKDERKDVTLAEEWEFVTCKACKEAESQ